MSQQFKVIQYLDRHYGQISIKEATRIGVSPRTLSTMRADGDLTRIAPGVYIDPIAFSDNIAAIQYRLSKAVFFKGTALFLHGLIKEIPCTYEVNLPLPYAYSNITGFPMHLYRQTKALYDIGITDVRTPEAHYVKTYNVERTLCDILRPRDRLDDATIKKAMIAYADSNMVNKERLMAYAERFKVADEMRAYVSILLWRLRLIYRFLMQLDLECNSNQL